MKEIWVPAKYFFKNVLLDFTGLYEVSNFGNCRSVERTVIYSDGRIYTYKSQPIKSFLNNSGYLISSLWKDRKDHKCLLHKLVLSSFKTDEWFVDAECDHIDSCKTNNCLENLRWVTREENLTTNHHSTMQKQNQVSKPVIQLSLNFEFIKEWNGVREIERELGFKHSNIANCCKGKSQSSYGYIWMYKDEWEIKKAV